jgi:hypothetical protein
VRRAGFPLLHKPVQAARLRALVMYHARGADRAPRIPGDGGAESAAAARNPSE